MRRMPIALAQPVFDGNERKYVEDVLATTRLSMGPYVARLEQQFADHTRRAAAVACSSGTAALHLALLAAGVGPGDLVLMPALSYVATANAAAYCGAAPVFCDIDPETWQMDVESAASAAHTAAAVHAAKGSGQRLRAIVAVDLYGGMGAMREYDALAGLLRVPLIVDAAESIGATMHDAPAGCLGDAAIFSLFGNKSITAGEGGILVTNSLTILDRAKLYRGQGQTPGRRYWHEVVGYNYRLTDLQAAVAVAQMERLAWHVGRRQEVARWYHRQLPITVRRQAEHPGGHSAHWMQVVELPEGVDRDVVAARLAQEGIETRPAFVPLHQLPMYQSALRVPVPHAERVGRSGLCLPTHAGLTLDDVRTVAGALEWAIR